MGREEMSKNNAAASVFDKFVEVGRLVYINQGKFQGKVAVIIDIVDANRVLVNGPTTDVPRHVINLKRVNLTDYRMKKLPRSCRSKTVKKFLQKSEILKKWEESNWNKKLKARATTTDFDRFKIYLARKKRSQFIREKVAAAS